MKNILFRYLAKSYTKYFGMVLSIVMAALLISNVFDTLSRFKSVSFNVQTFLKLISFKIPYLVLEILPLICFISALFFLRHLVKSCEFTAIFNSGKSVWTVLSSMILSTLCIGVSAITILSPISSALLSSYERIASKIEKKAYNTAISSAGIMVAESYLNENRIFITKSINTEERSMANPIILFLDKENNFIGRIDAVSATLKNSVLTLYEGKLLQGPEANITTAPKTIPTSLSISNFVQSSAAPEYISFWHLPSMINTIQKVGMPVLKYQIYYYKQLFKPLMMMTTIVMAACFIRGNHERKSDIKLLITGIVCGFIVYLFSEVCIVMLTHQGMGPMPAILISIFCIMIFSFFMILHLHETR